MRRFARNDTFIDVSGFNPILALVIAVGMAGAVLSGCTAPHPNVREGDANSVEIGYGGDVASAMPLARRHCAQFERVSLFVEATIDLASFKCVRR